MIIVHSPKEGEVETMEDLAHKLIEPGRCTTLSNP